MKVYSMFIQEHLNYSGKIDNDSIIQFLKNNNHPIYNVECIIKKDEMFLMPRQLLSGNGFKYDWSKLDFSITIFDSNNPENKTNLETELV